VLPYINEVLPDPPSGEIEWVEIYNPSTESAVLNNWRIRDYTDSNSTIFSATLPANSFLKIGNSHAFFNNSSSDYARLFDDQNKLIDQQPLKSVPDHQSFSRQSNGSWCLTETSPNKTNLPCLPAITTATAGPQINLEITDLLADPDEGDEWIKIYNPNNFNVDLSDWRVKDQSQSPRKITCLSVEAFSTCQAFFSSGFLNNDGDSVYLIDPQKRIISSYSYSNPLKATSTKKPIVTPKPTVTKKPPTGSSSGLNCPQVLGITLPPIASRSSRLTIKESNSPIMIFSTILMIGGTILILSPLLFHGSKNKNK